MEKEYQAVLPWFRVHIVILNDPGRLISVHIMHSGLLSGGMLFYEVIIVDPTDPVYNPTWRQGCYILSFSSRIGVIRSMYPWSLGIKLSMNLYWSYETMNAAYMIFSEYWLVLALVILGFKCIYL